MTTSLKTCTLPCCPCKTDTRIQGNTRYDSFVSTMVNNQQNNGIFMKFVLALAIALVNLSAIAHPGGKDAAGCHNDRKTGGYHCH